MPEKYQQNDHPEKSMYFSVATDVPVVFDWASGRQYPPMNRKIVYNAQPGFIEHEPFPGVRMEGPPPQEPYPLSGGETLFAEAFRDVLRNPELVTPGFMHACRESLLEAFRTYSKGLNLSDRKLVEDFDKAWAAEKYGKIRHEPNLEGHRTFAIERHDGNQDRTYPVEIYEDYKDEKYYHVFVITLAPGYTVTIRLNREASQTKNPFELIGVQIHDTGEWADGGARSRKEERNVDTDRWAQMETEPDVESLAEVIAALRRVAEMVHEDVLSCAVEGVRYRTWIHLLNCILGKIFGKF